MKPFTYLLALLVLLVPTSGDAGDYVTWTDEQGTVHFGDSDADIPPQYRRQVKEQTYTKPLPKSTVRDATQVTEAAIASDIDGKGEWKPKVYNIKFRRWEETARRIILDVRFNSKLTVPMILDTGAPGTMISYAVAEKLGLLSEKSGGLMARAGGIGGTTPAIKTILDTVEVEGMKDTFVPTTVADFRRDGLYEGLLGMSFMSNYSMTIDHAHGRLTFTELPPDRRRPGGHDREWWISTYLEFAGQRKRWRSYQKQFEGMKYKGGVSTTTLDLIKEVMPFIRRQERQASNMFDKLDRYASYNAVPTEWRRY